MLTHSLRPGLDTELAEPLLSLGDLGAADDYARHIADQTAHLRGKANSAATVTQVAVAERDLERAAETMLDLARGMESRRLNDRYDADSPG